MNFENKVETVEGFGSTGTSGEYVTWKLTRLPWRDHLGSTRFSHLHDANNRVSVELLVVVLLPVQQLPLEERHLLSGPDLCVSTLDSVRLELADAAHIFFTTWSIFVSGGREDESMELTIVEEEEEERFECRTIAFSARGSCI